MAAELQDLWQQAKSRSTSVNMILRKQAADDTKKEKQRSTNEKKQQDAYPQTVIN